MKIIHAEKTKRWKISIDKKEKRIYIWDVYLFHTSSFAQFACLVKRSVWKKEFGNKFLFLYKKIKFVPTTFINNDIL